LHEQKLAEADPAKKNFQKAKYMRQISQKEKKERL